MAAYNFTTCQTTRGGLYVREYTREFPAAVAGIVLLDSASPQQIDVLPGFRAQYEADKRNAARELWSDRLRVWSGWERLSGHCHQTPGKGLQARSALYDAKVCRPRYVDGDLGEYLDFEASARDAAQRRRLEVRLRNKLPELTLGTGDLPPGNSWIIGAYGERREDRCLRACVFERSCITRPVRAACIPISIFIES